VLGLLISTASPRLQAITEFIALRTIVQNQEPLNVSEDKFIWRLAPNRKYSSALAYTAFFQGTTEVDYAKGLWKNWAPLKEKIFCWLAFRNRCWTADRLTKRGLEALEFCTFCDQEQENINHLITNCPFTRKFWFLLCSSRGAADMVPQQYETVRQWWYSISSSQPKERRKERQVVSVRCIFVYVYFPHLLGGFLHILTCTRLLRQTPEDHDGLKMINGSHKGDPADDATAEKSQ
jgi:hypothetical protein